MDNFKIKVGEREYECKLTLASGRRFQEEYLTRFGTPVKVLAWLDKNVGDHPPEELALFYSCVLWGERLSPEHILEHMDYASVIAAQTALGLELARSIPEELKKKKEELMEKMVQTQVRELLEKVLNNQGKPTASPA